MKIKAKESLRLQVFGAALKNKQQVPQRKKRFWTHAARNKTLAYAIF